MDTAPRTGRIGRGMLAISTIAFLATGMLSTVSTTAHANPFCLVTNETSSVQGSDLQQAINDATSGDTISVTGVCFGNFTVDGKTLTFRGVSTPARKYPTLDAASSGTVLSMFNGAVVTIKDLVITHGHYLFGGGGISVNLSTLILNGSTRVVHNTAFEGGGIYSLDGSVTFNGSARVNLNGAAYGGGVFLDTSSTGSTLTMNKTSRVNNNDAGDYGGGVYGGGSSITMNGSATIVGNTAGTDGGGIFGGTTTGATAGGNVRNNNPDDIA